eukprot:1215403-Prymnesium_polylepis.1
MGGTWAAYGRHTSGPMTMRHLIAPPSLSPRTSSLPPSLRAPRPTLPLSARARQALETDTLHREEIASYGRRLLAADNTHEELVDAADQLKEACISVREAVGIAGSAAKPMVKPSASMPNAEVHVRGAEAAARSRRARAHAPCRTPPPSVASPIPTCTCLRVARRAARA